MKRGYLGKLIIAVVLVAGLILVSCTSSPTTTSAPTSTTSTAKPTTTSATTTTSSTATVKPIELTWTIIETDAVGSNQDMHREMVKQIAEKTQGRVTVKLFWGGTLGKITDFLKMVSNGAVAQGGTLVGTFHQWEIPMWTAAGMPFFTKGYRIAPKAVMALGNEWDPMKTEVKSANIKVLGMIQAHEPIIIAKDPITSLDSLKGKKMWVAGFWQALANELGIVNVPLSSSDVYDALQKGTISGIWGIGYQSSQWNKWYELNKNFYALPFGGQTLIYDVVNLDVWNKISAADQKTIETIMSDLTTNYYPNLMDKEVTTLKTFYKDNGVTEASLSDADLTKIQTVGQTAIWNSWIKTAKEKGVPADEWLQRYQAKVAELSK